MIQSVRAWVGGEGGKGAGVSEEGLFIGPFCAPVRVVPHLNRPISQPMTGRLPKPSAPTTAQPSSTLFCGPSGDFTQGENRRVDITH